MDINRYILGVKSGYAKPINEISKPDSGSALTTHTYLSLDFDSIKDFTCFKFNALDTDKISSVDTVFLNNNLYLIEFKTDVASFRNLRLKFSESLIILIKSLNEVNNDKDDINSIVNSFGNITYVVVKHNFVQKDRELLKKLQYYYKSILPKEAKFFTMIKNKQQFDKDFGVNFGI